jgi:two-component system, chemotaxis family, sensor kinase Cph1
VQKLNATKFGTEVFMVDVQQHSKPVVTIETCDREQIHIPGSVQSFGSVLVFDTEYNITRASENIEALTNVSAAKLIGAPLSKMLGADQIAQLAEFLKSNEHTNIALTFKSEVNTCGVVRKVGEEYCLDLVQDSNKLDSFNLVRQFVAALSASSTQQDTVEIITKEIRRISNFDRVKVYKFDKDWNGEVIAESRREGMVSYLGLNFPESDIPKQARELYARNRVRVIGDVNGAQSPIVEKRGLKPLDLSFSFVRSVSPIHLQYLKNMSVSSSMSISLFERGKFWGLIACHHETPRTFDFSEEVFYRTISDLCSQRLSSIKLEEEAAQQFRSLSFIQPMMAELDKTEDLQNLLTGSNSLDDLVRATGVAISADSTIYKKNAVPDDATLQMLVSWLDRGSENLFVCDDLPSRFGEYIGAYACGLLAIKIPLPVSFWIMWLRFEVTKEVNWIRDPYQPKETTPFGNRLYPNTSFAIWKESKRGHSAPWQTWEIQAARDLAKFIEGSKIGRH